MALSVNAGAATGSGDGYHALIPAATMYQVVFAQVSVSAYTGKGVAGMRTFYRDEMLPMPYSSDESSNRQVLADCGVLRLVTACASTQVSAQVTAAGKAGLAADTAGEPATAHPQQSLQVGSTCILPLT